MRPQSSRPLAMVVALLASLAAGIDTPAQTRITPDRNKYSPAQDVTLGQEAAAQVKQEVMTYGAFAKAAGLKPN